MGRNYFYTGRSGESTEDIDTVHAERGCHHLQNSDDPVRPIDESMAPEDSKRCGVCFPLENDSSTDTGSGEDDGGSEGEILERVEDEDD